MSQPEPGKAGGILQSLRNLAATGVALVQGLPLPYPPADGRVLAILRDFEAAYEAYAEFQRAMERYWSLRWLVQEQRSVMSGTVLRESLVRLEELPLVVRVPSLPALPAGARVALSVGHIDLLDLSVHCEYQQQLEPPLAAA